MLESSSSAFLVEAQKKNISMEDIWTRYLFVQESVSGINSMNDGIHYTSLDRKNGGSAVVMYSYETGKELQTLVSDSSINKEGFSIDAYQFSADESKLLLATETEQIYRHSTRSSYYIYDRSSKELQALSAGKQRYATFSPGGSKVAFVKDNNLFVKDLKSGRELRITRDGIKNRVIYGATDWVYEEEFAFDKAFFCRPMARASPTTVLMKAKYPSSPWMYSAPTSTRTRTALNTPRPEKSTPKCTSSSTIRIKTKVFPVDWKCPTNIFRGLSGPKTLRSFVCM